MEQAICRVSSSPLSQFDQLVTRTLHHPLLESKVQTQLSLPSENQVTTCFHPLTDMPLYGGCKSALLMSAVPLYTSGKGRISIAAYKCLALMKNSPQRSESMVQLPVPITYLCPRASLEPCKCES